MGVGRSSGGLGRSIVVVTGDGMEGKGTMTKGMTALTVALMVAVGTSWGCGGPEERKAKYRLRAQEYIQQGNFPKARVALRNVLKIDPKDAEAYFLYAQVEEKERNWRNAVAGYQQVVELKPDHEQALVKLGKFYLEGRALDKAAEMADRLLAKSPTHVSARALKISIQALSGQTAEATAQAERLAADAPTDVDAVLLLASLHTIQQRADLAVPAIQRALERHPDNVELLDALATTLVRQGRPDEAEAILNRLVAVEPTMFSHRLRLMAFYDQRKAYDKAEGVLQEAIRLEPDNDQRRLALVEYVAKRRGTAEGEARLLAARRELPRSAKLWFAEGAFYEATGRPTQARETYEAIVKDYGTKPEGLEAQVKLAALDWKEGKADEADRRLQDVLKENPRSSEALLVRGKIALQRGNGKDATQDFRSVLKDQPELVEGHLLLARAYLATGEVSLARESLDRALMLNPGLNEAHMLLAGLDASAGRVKEARQRMEKLVEKEPGNLMLLGQLLQLQAQEKDWSQTEETLRRLRMAGAARAAADLAEGYLAAAQQEWDKAQTAIERAYEQRPLAPEPLVALVQLDMRRGRGVQAQQRLEAVLAEHPDHPYAEGLLGELLLAKGDVQQAMPHLEAAARLNPQWATPWGHLARQHYTAKRWAEGDAVLVKALSFEDHEQLRLLLAGSLGAQRRFDEAMTHYEAVLKRNPKSLLAANNLAALLIDHRTDPKSWERALALSKPFEAQKPNPYLLDTLGWAHHKLGHGEEAVRLLKQATALAPEHPVLNYHLGAAYSKTGQREEAQAHLKKAVQAGAPFDGLEDAKALLAEVAG